MTEREAWEELAGDAGRERARLAQGDHYNAGITYNGLCGGLDRLPVSDVVRKRMRARIRRECTRRWECGAPWAYLWPLTPSGFKRRAAWARKQAARRAR